MSDQETNGRRGFSGVSLLLWFAGGALAGAAAAYLAQAQNRAHVRELAQRTRDRAGRLPQALRDASSAAQSAFAESYQGNAEAAAIVEPK
jgi:hypothetical protein